MSGRVHLKIASSETNLNFLCSSLGMVLTPMEPQLYGDVTDEDDNVECFFCICFFMSFLFMFIFI